MNFFKGKLVLKFMKIATFLNNFQAQWRVLKKYSVLSVVKFWYNFVRYTANFMLQTMIWQQKEKWVVAKPFSIPSPYLTMLELVTLPINPFWNLHPTFTAPLPFGWTAWGWSVKWVKNKCLKIVIKSQIHWQKNETFKNDF